MVSCAVEIYGEVMITPQEGSVMVPSGREVEYRYLVVNTGTVSDSFNLEAETDWSVQFYASNGDACGTVTIASTGEILPDETVTIFAKVITPADLPEGRSNTTIIKIRSQTYSDIFAVATLTTTIGMWWMYQQDLYHSGYSPDTVIQVLTLGSKWSFPANITGGIAVANGVVYFGGSNGLYALHASNGEQIWYYPTNESIRSTPIIVNNRIYFSTTKTNFYALESNNGNYVWSYPYPTNTSGSSISSPVVNEGIFYCGGKGEGDPLLPQTLFALDAGTGLLKWLYRTEGSLGESSPIVIPGRVYITGKNFYALDSKDGKLIWSYNSVQSLSKSFPIVNEVAYVPVGKNIYAIDMSNGSRTWTYSMGENSIYYPPIVVEDKLYVGCVDGSCYAFDVKTGLIVWSHLAGEIGNEITSAPIFANGILYMVIKRYSDEWGDYWVICGLDPLNGNIVWSYSLGGKSSPCLAIANGVLYGGDNSNLYAFTNFYNINGTVTSLSGEGMPGVTVILTGDANPIETTTGEGGAYGFSSVPVGRYTITPSQSGYEFTPSSKEIVVTQDSSQNNFTGYPSPGTITGCALFDLPRIDGHTGILVTVVDVMNTTDILGYFVCSGIPPGVYGTVTAYAPGASGGVWHNVVVITGSLTTLGTITLLNADVNENGVVNMNDFDMFKDTFLKREGETGWRKEADSNGDGLIDTVDFGYLRVNFGRTIDEN